MDIVDTQDRIINEFSQRTDWFDKYEYLIGMGKAFNADDPELKTDDNRISGCQSDVWLRADLRNGSVKIFAYSDAMITRGIISLLLRVLNDRTPAEIVQSELYFIERIGLNSNLSPSRWNGLASILNAIRTRARVLMSSEVDQGDARAVSSEPDEL